MTPRLPLLTLALAAYAAASGFACGTGANAAQCSALSDLYNLCGGAGWRNQSGWAAAAAAGSGGPPPNYCAFAGVGCAAGSVVSLASTSVTNMGPLVGSLPSSLGALTALTALTLSCPAFGGTAPSAIAGGLPSSLGALASLTSLAMPSCGLSGTLPPQLGSLGKLARLQLQGNDLTGAVPPAFASLTGLLLLCARPRGCPWPPLATPALTTDPTATQQPRAKPYEWQCASLLWHPDGSHLAVRAACCVLRARRRSHRETELSPCPALHAAR